MRICRAVAWEVDAALRPEGKSGALVRTLASHQAYYRRWASTWEFQALLKARPIAGDLALGADYLDALAPLVWTASQRPDFVADVQAMRRRVVEQLPPTVVDREIKLGPGRPARCRVRRPVAAAGARPGRPGAAGAGHPAGAGRAARRRVRRPGRRGQPGRCLPVPAGGRAPAAAGQAAPDPPGARASRRRCCGWPGRWVSGRTPAATRSRSGEAEWALHAREVRRLHEKLFYRPLLEAVARVPTEALRLTPRARPGDGWRRSATPTRARAAAHRVADRRGVAAGRPATGAVAGDPVRAGRRARTRTGACSATGRCPTRSGRPRGSFGCCATRARWRPGWRSCSAPRATSPTCWCARRRPCSCWPTTPSCRPAPGPSWGRDGERGPPAGRADAEAAQAIRSLRRVELLRMACADLLGRLDGRGCGTGRQPGTDATLDAALGRRRPVAARTSTPTSADRVRGDRDGPARRQEIGYGSDADVLFVFDPATGMRRTKAPPEGARGGRAAAQPCSRRRPPTRRSGGRRPAPGGPQRSAGAVARLLRRVLRAVVVGVGGPGAAAGPVLRRRRGAGRAVRPADRSGALPGRRASARDRVPRSGGSRAGSTPSGYRAAPTRTPTSSSAGAAWPTSSGRCSCCSWLTGSDIPTLRTPARWPRCGPRAMRALLIPTTPTRWRRRGGWPAGPVTPSCWCATRPTTSCPRRAVALVGVGRVLGYRPDSSPAS